jgi:hypothetical protein
MSIDVSRMPRRIQLRRKKGFRLQEVSRALNGLPAVKVARPGKFGNPYKVGVSPSMFAKSCDVPTLVSAVKLFRAYANLKVQHDPTWAEELRGKNLACFCPPDQPCHADVLIEIANQ